MPSGAKKRKAAKKKKEKEASYAPHSHGGDDLKLHDEKESDGGETSSPLSQDHHNHQHPFTEGEEEKMDKREEDTSSVQSTITENEPIEGDNGNGESTDKVAIEGKSGIQIDGQIKHEDDSEPKHVTIYHVELERKSSSSSSSISSDDESEVVKNIEVINWEEPIEYATNLSAEAALLDDLEKTADLPEVTQVDDTFSHIGLVGQPKEEAYEPVSADGPLGTSIKPADLPEITTITEAVPVVEDNDFILGKSKVEATNLVVETIPHIDPVILSKEEAHFNEGLGLKENGKKENSGVSLGVIDMGSQSNKDAVSFTATANSEVLSVATVEENESKTVPPSCVPSVEISNGAEHINDSVTESSNRQTPVALAPRPVQTTSWKGCCGLFELFAGSNR